ncbi:MAG: hypothetical protein JHC33_11845 [Ignisphaera sp.]|nr:hypothetical protein [Ignisphaera sp.]
MNEVAIRNLISLIIRLCGLSEDIAEIGRNPLEVAKHCARQGHNDLALLLLHLPLTHNLMTSAGLMLASPWEQVVNVCVLKKSELESANLHLRELKSFTIDATIGSRGREEEEREERLRSESYYVAVLDVLDARTNERHRKAYVYYLAPLSDSSLQFNVFIILDTKWVEMVKALCQS